jgi:crotonobetainyl-CoA:carnitine CoA-transferase CaiB-like acyl-CoA transferase
LWENLCQALGRPEFVPYARRPEHLWRAPNAAETAVRDALQMIFRQRTRDAWVAFLSDKNVCIGAVNTVAEVFDDPQVRHRQMLLEHHSDAVGSVRQAGIALKLSDTPGQVRRLGPRLGQHTAEVLAALGYGDEDITRLRTSGIVG